MDRDLDLTQVSPRELQCLALVSCGLESKHIAPLLGISPGAVDTNLKRAAKRTGISGRKQLAGLLRRRHPELIQSTIQRLGHSEKSLAAMALSEPVAGADDVFGMTQRPSGWSLPIPTAERPWNDLSGLQKRVWAVAIAVGVLITGLLLVNIAHKVLVQAPRPVELDQMKG